jgi:hypothetical protein
MEIPVTGYENLPLCHVERTLRYKVEEYRKIKESRLRRLVELENKVSMVIQNEKCLHFILSQILHDVLFGLSFGYVYKILRCGILRRG